MRNNVKRNLYVVYADSVLDYGDGHVETKREKVGQTLAVSPAKAVAQIAFRLKIKTEEYVPWSYDGARTTKLVAEIA